MTAIANLVGESIWISQYNPQGLEIGFIVHRDGEPAQPDEPDSESESGSESEAQFTMKVTVETLSDDPEAVAEVIAEREADNPETGVFTITPSSAETQEAGFYKVTWTYTIDGQEQFYVHALEVVPASSALDSLPEDFHSILNAVWMRFADLFDSPFGGPHLQVYYQTRFNRGRVAELMGTALRKLNVIAQPHMTYTIDGEGGNVFPVARWGGVLEQATYIECIKHLIRSYTEMPDTPGVTVARLDRNRYMDRWNSVLQMELQDYKKTEEGFKIAHMGLGRPQILVAGGVYGTYGPTRLPLSAAARPRYHWRFH